MALDSTHIHETNLATESQPISKHAAAGRLAPLVGLSVSRPWLGHGAALFLELGRLAINERGRQQGEASVMLDCDWLLGGTGLGLVDRDAPDDTIMEEIRQLENLRVSSIDVNPTNLSLNLSFESGRWIRALVRNADESSWTVFLSDGWWIAVENSQLVSQRGIESVHDRAV